MSVMRLYRGYERLAAGLAAVSALAILAMSLWITYDVLARYFFDVASPWAFDLAEYSLVWITFLGAPWVLMRDRHIRIELLVDGLSPQTQRKLGAAVSAIALFVCLVLMWRTGLAAIDYLETNTMMPRIWRIPKFWPYVILPIGIGFLAVAFLLRLAVYLSLRDPEAFLKERASEGQITGASTRDETDAGKA
jgi:TRAP-type C4-dicarboxylate transport system permease small subunit